MKYKLGCSTWGAGIESRIESVKFLAEAGFDVIMLPAFLEDPKGCQKLIQTIRDLGMDIDEIHAPFKNINHIWYDDPSCDAVLEELLLCVDRCVDNAVYNMVVHDSSGRVGPDTSNAGLSVNVFKRSCVGVEVFGLCKNEVLYSTALNAYEEGACSVLDLASAEIEGSGVV